MLAGCTCAAPACAPAPWAVWLPCDAGCDCPPPEARAPPPEPPPPEPLLEPEPCSNARPEFCEVELEFPADAPAEFPFDCTITGLLPGLFTITVTAMLTGWTWAAFACAPAAWAVWLACCETSPSVPFSPLGCLAAAAATLSCRLGSSRERERDGNDDREQRQQAACLLATVRPGFHRERPHQKFGPRYIGTPPGRESKGVSSEISSFPQEPKSDKGISLSGRLTRPASAQAHKWANQAVSIRLDEKTSVPEGARHTTRHRLMRSGGERLGIAWRKT